MDDPFAPVPVAGPVSEDEINLFGEYRHLVPIFIEGRRFLVPEGNSVLRGLQFLEIKQGAVKMQWGRFCWNNTTGCCEMTYRMGAGAPEQRGRGCQVHIAPGLEIVCLPIGGRLVEER